jgi:glycosyltransferase involved in cell wall biosynthesis
LDANYPNNQNLYGDVFVHVRVKEYIRRGHDVRVIVFFTQGIGYTFDGVKVECTNDLELLKSLIEDFRPDVIAVHFFQGWMLKKLFAQSRCPIVVWVHGVEALGWYRRLFTVTISTEFLRYVAFNTLQMVRFRRLILYANEHPNRLRFVFVSNWMRRTTEVDTRARVSFYSIIPNPIDTDRFPYVEKPAPQRLNVLLVRSFDSRKYANDIAVAAILRLSRSENFGEFQFSIRGSGRMFDRLTRPLLKFQNVTVKEGFLTHSEIADLHKSHGVFLCPTRQDAQGVSMCEAMSSGLVPVTSRSSAIPEFVDDHRNGFLTDGAAGIVRALSQLRANPSLFECASKAAAQDIRAKSALRYVADSELELMSGLVENLS